MTTGRPAWLVWQLADSAFPTGAFAHSSGLESAWRAGELADSNALRQFVRGILWQAGYGLMPLATAAYRAPARLGELDALADVFLLNPVANRASRVQGRTLLATCARVWPSGAWAGLQDRVRSLAGHVGPLTGVVFRELEVPLPTTQELILFTAARGVLSAAVRLGIIGSYQAQRMQVDAGDDFSAVLARCAAFDERDLAQASPLVDILQATHDRLYSRLFQS